MITKILVDGCTLFDSHAANYKVLGVSLHVYLKDTDYSDEKIQEVMELIQAKLNEKM